MPNVPFYRPGVGFMGASTVASKGRAASGMPKLSAKSMKNPDYVKPKSTKKKATTKKKRATAKQPQKLTTRTTARRAPLKKLPPMKKFSLFPRRIGRR